MSKRLDGRRAIVTGAADGMGRATAQLFAEHGAQVLAVDIQADRLRELGAQSPAITPLVQDIGAPEAAGTIVSAAIDRLGGLDILMNNAGIRGERGPIQQESDENWDRVMTVNLEAAFRLSRAATPHLLRSVAGRIINVSSIQGFLAAPTLGTYSVSKHGVVGLTRAFALDLGPQGITVNAILPGFIETGLTRTMKNDQPDIYARVTGKAALKRAGQPIEIAHTALFLASAEASYITGACIPVDGGATCW